MMLASMMMNLLTRVWLKTGTKGGLTGEGTGKGPLKNVCMVSDGVWECGEDG